MQTLFGQNIKVKIIPMNLGISNVVHIRIGFNAIRIDTMKHAFHQNRSRTSKRVYHLAASILFTFFKQIAYPSTGKSRRIAIPTM